MYEQRYNKIKSWITSSRIRLFCFAFIYKALPAVMFAAYPLLLLYLALTRDERLIKCTAVPLLLFVTLSAGRAAINRKRPYEKYPITPIYAKDTAGKSFPSRHTGSAAIIAATFLYIFPPIGAAFAAAALLIGASRIAGGVHFPIDVLAAFVYAAICGALYLV